MALPMGTHRDFTPVLFFSNLYQCKDHIRPHVLTEPVPFKPGKILNLKKFVGVPFECEQNLRGENIDSDNLFSYRSKEVTQMSQGLRWFIKS